MALRSMFVAMVLLAMAVQSVNANSPGPALHVGVGSINDLMVPDRPYDASADAARAVDQALARAAQNHKNVLIDLGGNWCADCRILSAVMALPEVQPFLSAHYEIVLVDVGRFDRNLQIAARFGITQKFEGVPVILIVTPDGHLVNKDHIATLDDARNMTPQGIADWLAQWAR